MKKTTLQEFINGEHDSLLASIDLFRTLLPHQEKSASVHSGEEGRFIELALMQYLRDKLPAGIGIGGGFVVDIKSGWNSKQIDILLYDDVKYAPIMKYGDAVVLPIQAVIGAISVKRKLYKRQIENEIHSLTEIGSRAGGTDYPKPYLSIVAFDYSNKSVTKGKSEVFEAISDYYTPKLDCKSRTQKYSWNELLDSVIVFDKFLIRGSNFTPEDGKDKTRSKYLWTGGKDTKRNLYIQHLLYGIHRAWYDERRGNKRVGDLLSFPSAGMEQLDIIECCQESRKYYWDKFIPYPTSTNTKK